MTTINRALPTLIGCPTPDADLCDGLALDGTEALRLTVNSESAGIIAGGGYYYAAMVLWLDSAVSGGVYLLEVGRTTGIAIGFHTDPVGNGNPAVCVAINDGNSANAYAARFEIDLRSGAGERELRSLELTYVGGSGFTLVVDGVEVAAAATGGTDNGIGGSSLTTHGTLGGSLNLNTLRTRGALNVPSVVGTQGDWPSGDNTTTPAGMITGGVAYVRLEVSAGVAALDMPLISDVVDRIDAGGTGVNDPTNGTQLVPSGTPSFDALVRHLITDENELAIDDPVEVTSDQGDAAPTTTIRLWNPSGSNFSCSGLTVVESGVSSVLNYVYLGSDIPVASLSALTIPAGGYIEAVIEHDNASAGDDQPGGVEFGSAEQVQSADFLLSVTAAVATVARRSRGRGRSRMEVAAWG